MSKDKNQIIVGISREIVDTETDSSAAFHVIRYLSLDVASGFHSVTVDSYVRKSTFDRGGRAVGSMQFNLTGKPPRGSDIQDWAYRSIVAEIEAGTTDSVGAPGLANSLTGADLVYADLPDAV